MWRALDDWEMYLHDAAPQLPLLIRCALVHYQFEAIGPFLDGNARLGRLFIILCLVALGRLPLTGGAKPHPSAAAGHKHDGAPHDPLWLVVDGGELALAQQHVQYGDQLSHRKVRTQTALHAAAERNPGIGLRPRTEEPLGAELVWVLIHLGAAVDRDDVDHDSCASLHTVTADG